MLRIDDTIFSFDILEKKFICDLRDCHGSCCREGDSGAPLTEVEVRVFAENMAGCKGISESLEAKRQWRNRAQALSILKMTP